MKNVKQGNEFMIIKMTNDEFDKLHKILEAVLDPVLFDRLDIQDAEQLLKLFSSETKTED